MSATLIQSGGTRPGGTRSPALREALPAPGDGAESDVMERTPTAGDRVALPRDDVQAAPTVGASDNPDLLPGQCEHYTTLIARTPTRWTSSDWSLVQVADGKPDLPKPFASTIDTEDPFACTLGIAAATGSYLIRQRSSLWEAEISLDCGHGQVDDLAIPPTWPLNIYVLDASGQAVRDVHVSVMRGKPEENVSTSAAAQAGDAFSAHVVSGAFTVAVHGATPRPIFQAVDVADAPMDVIVDVQSGARFEVDLQFRRNGEIVRVSRDELREVQALDAGHNDALISKGGRLRAEPSPRDEVDDMRRALQLKDQAALGDYLSGFEVVSLVLNSTNEVTVRALGMDIPVDPGRAGSVLVVDVP